MVVPICFCVTVMVWLVKVTGGSFITECFALILFIELGVLMAIGAKEDWDTSSISGELGLGMWIAIVGGTVILWDRLPVANVILLLVLVIMYYAPFEMKWWGDADLLPIAAYLVVFFIAPIDTIVCIIYPLVLGLLMIPYGVCWGRLKGVEWKFGAGIPLQGLPLFAISWWVAGLCAFIYSMLSKGGTI